MHLGRHLLSSSDIMHLPGGHGEPLQRLAQRLCSETGRTKRRRAAPIWSVVSQFLLSSADGMSLGCSRKQRRGGENRWMETAGRPARTARQTACNMIQKGQRSARSARSAHAGLVVPMPCQWSPGWRVAWVNAWCAPCPQHSLPRQARSEHASKLNNSAKLAGQWPVNGAVQIPALVPGCCIP